MNHLIPHTIFRFLCALTLLLAFAGCSSNGGDDNSDDREPAPQSRTITLDKNERQSITLNLLETVVVQFRNTDAGHTWKPQPSKLDESVVRVTPQRVQAATVQQSFTLRGAKTGRETVEFIQVPVGDKKASPTARATLEVQVGR